MAKSSLMKKQVSTVTNELCNEEEIMDYEAAYTLQANSIGLQDAERKMFKKLIAILSKSSEDMRELQKDLNKIFPDIKQNSTQHENLWRIFDTAVSSFGLVIEENDNNIDKLESVQKTIPNETKRELLKDKIQKIQSTANKLSKEITALKRKEEKFRNQIYQQRTGSWRYTLRRKLPRTHQNKLKDKLKDVQRSMKDKTASLKIAKTKANREAVDILEQYTEAEIRLNQAMKERLTEFVHSFNISSKEFQKALTRCNPRKDIDRWKQNILYTYIEQSSEYSDEEEDHDEKIDRRRKFIESLSTENKSIDEEIYQSFKSIRCRSIENENTDNRRVIRQSSRRSTSTVNKNRDKKTKTSQVSRKFQAIDSDDMDDSD